MLARKTFLGDMMVGGGRIGPRALASAMITLPLNLFSSIFLTLYQQHTTLMLYNKGGMAERSRGGEGEKDRQR